MLTTKEADRLLAVALVSGGSIPPRRVPRDIRDRAPLTDLLTYAARDRGVLEDGHLVVGEPHRCNVRDVIEPYLLDESVSRSYKTFVRRAVGQLCNLPDGASVADVLDAAEGLPMTEAYTLPERAWTRIRDSGGSEANANNARSALRRALEEAAAGSDVGYVIPRPWLDADEGEDVTGRILEALAELWVSGETPTQQRINELGGVNPASLTRRIETWVAEGQATVRRDHRGQGLMCVGLLGANPEETTLATLLRAAEAEKALSDSRRSQVFQAVRGYLELGHGGWRQNVEEVLEAAESVRYDELQGLPDRVEAWAESCDRFSEGTPSVYASAIRALLRWAGARGVLPLSWEDHPERVWDEARDEWLPGGGGKISGVKASTRASHRTAWTWLREALLDLHAPGLRPEDLTEEHVNDACDWLKKRGRFDHAGAVSSALNFAGRRGFGPRQGLRTSQSILLGGPDGVSQDYGLFLDGLDAAGLTRGIPGMAEGEQGDWRAFFQWLRDWSTLPHSRLVLKGMPDRPTARRLSDRTLLGRAKAVRWLLGLYEMDGWDLNELPLLQAFSVEATVDGKVVGLRRMFALGQELWEKRFKTGDLTSPVGSSIRGYIVSCGLVSEALYRWCRHHSGHKVAALPSEVQSKYPRYGIASEEEETKGKSHVESSLWAAYQHSKAVNSAMREEARSLNRGGDTQNTEKDIRLVMERTPPRFLLQTHDGLLDRARRSVEADGQTKSHHLVIRDAFLNAILISCGPRGEEVVHIRDDTHLVRGSGTVDERWWDPTYEGPLTIVLRAIDRKNGRAHAMRVHPRYLPAWLRVAYLATSRPALIHQGGGAKHHHLIVDNGGRAFGCPEEHADGTGRPPGKAIEKRVGALRDLWKNHIGRVAWDEAGLECPTEDGYWTLHIVRNAIGAGIYSAHGVSAAANWLGDRESSVEGHYGCLDGRVITADMMGDLHLEWSDGEKENSPATQEEVDELLTRLRSLGVTEGRILQAVRSEP